MTRFNRIAAAAFAAGALALSGPAFAQTIAENSYYPRVVGSGENAEVEYGPGPAQNIVGGGAVSVTEEPNGSVHIRHTDSSFAQQGRQGLRAVTVGSGESERTIWVPSADAGRRADAGFRG
ncbi:hypothetical protein HB662_10260 [Roseomonas frigidaquae]|uniref:Curlin associated repeat-containing protein n=1 Tax=Falsiroseomonas frigidaquae TaxID=487318 RepID=A0ABX1EYK4_9PROT|nr:hypothetical protein [Falsiroseomonas frigidaquae]NKE45162.1 hypothetical protein [Falsiroseomonas frigidaquae]